MEGNPEIRINKMAEHLFHVMEQRSTQEDVKRINDAFLFAKEAHSAQRRKSGEPYITHPLQVAIICAEELHLDADSIIAALLHDVVEDTDHTVAEITERYGYVVAQLVKALTKKKKDHYLMSKQLDNFKQMLDFVGYDIRGILIKLADRLHNMRTLSSMAPEKQMKIAGETDFFYAPLANRLGLYNIKTELENLSLRYRCPSDYDKIHQLLQEDKIKNAPQLDRFMSKIEYLMARNDITARVSSRERMPYSIWKRINTTGRDFWHIDKRRSVNIVFPTPTDASEKNICLRIYSVLSDNFKERPNSIVNFIDAPKENGYQSFHATFLTDNGEWVEVHISSERMLRKGRLGCIADNDDGNIQQWIEGLKEVLREIAYNGNKNGNFMEGMTSTFHNDDITVYSPKGNTVILPVGSTALDYAFAIHTNIGLKAHYVRINGKISSIRTPLQRGDCVEVITSEEIKPTDSWANAVITYKAKRLIRSFLKHQPHLPFNRCPFCYPLPGDEVIGFREPDSTTTIHKRDCHEAIRQASQDGDSILSVTFPEMKEITYPVRLVIKAIDRFHLLIDFVECISSQLHLSIDNLHTITTDQIVDCTIEFNVHSAQELRHAASYINAIEGVDEVRIQYVR